MEPNTKRKNKGKNTNKRKTNIYNKLINDNNGNEMMSNTQDSLTEYNNLQVTNNDNTNTENIYFIQGVIERNKNIYSIFIPVDYNLMHRIINITNDIKIIIDSCLTEIDKNNIELYIKGGAVQHLITYKCDDDTKKMFLLNDIDFFIHIKYINNFSIETIKSTIINKMHYLIDMSEYIIPSTSNIKYKINTNNDDDYVSNETSFISKIKAICEKNITYNIDISYKNDDHLVDLLANQLSIKFTNKCPHGYFFSNFENIQYLIESINKKPQILLLFQRNNINITYSYMLSIIPRFVKLILKGFIIDKCITLSSKNKCVICYYDGSDNKNDKLKNQDESKNDYSEINFKKVIKKYAIEYACSVKENKHLICVECIIAECASKNNINDVMLCPLCRTNTKILNVQSESSVDINDIKNILKWYIINIPNKKEKKIVEKNTLSIKSMVYNHYKSFKNTTNQSNNEQTW